MFLVALLHVLGGLGVRLDKGALDMVDYLGGNFVSDRIKPWILYRDPSHDSAPPKNLSGYSLVEMRRGRQIPWFWRLPKEWQARISEDGIVVGRGAFGEVAVAPVIGKCKPGEYKVAIKLTQGERPLRTTKNEVKMLMTLSRLSPHIVGYWGDMVGTTHAIILEEALSGGDGISFMKGVGKLNHMKRLSLVLLDMLKGLAAMHEYGFIHRDIKPDNVMMTEGDPPRGKLADFGLACREPGPYRVLGPPCTGHSGTIVYMSPEALGTARRTQDAMGAYTWATDIWAMGLTAWAMAFGNLPPTLLAAMKGKQEGDMRDFVHAIRREFRGSEQGRNFIPEVDLGMMPAHPRELANLLSAMLRSSPANRPTAKALVGVDGLATRFAATMGNSALLDSVAVPKGLAPSCWAAALVEPDPCPTKTDVGGCSNSLWSKKCSKYVPDSICTRFPGEMDKSCACNAGTCFDKATASCVGKGRYRPEVSPGLRPSLSNLPRYQLYPEEDVSDGM